MEKQVSRQRLHQIRFAERYHARVTVQRAVKSGYMPKASELHCVYCGKPAAQYHHFFGYKPSERLVVWPCCDKCHGKIPKAQRTPSPRKESTRPEGWLSLSEAARATGRTSKALSQSLRQGFRLEDAKNINRRWWVSLAWVDAYKSRVRKTCQPENRNLKLTAAQAEEIRQRFAAKEPQKKLAAEFGVSVPMISAIVCGRAYTSAPMEASA